MTCRASRWATPSRTSSWTTYEPSTGGFGEFDLAKNKADGRWTILFFYPADFTFV